MKNTLHLLVAALALAGIAGCGNSSSYTGKPKGTVDANGIETLPEGTRVVRDDGLK